MPLIPWRLLTPTKSDSGRLARKVTLSNLSFLVRVLPMCKDFKMPMLPRRPQYIGVDHWVLFVFLVDAMPTHTQPRICTIGGAPNPILSVRRLFGQLETVHFVLALNHTIASSYLPSMYMCMIDSQVMLEIRPCIAD